MVAITTETIGAGGDYATIELWLAAHNGKDLVALDERYDGELIDDKLEIVPNSIAVPAYPTGCNTDATRFRYLRNSTTTTTRYDFASNVGAKLYGSWLAGSAIETFIDIQEDHFLLRGIGLICEDPDRTTGTGGNVKCGIKINADSVRLWSVSVKIAEGGEFDDAGGTEPYFYCYWTGSSGADDVQFWNCVAMGSPFHRGANLGWFFDSSASNGGVYNCTAYAITHGLGRGIWSLPTTNRPERINCVAIGSSYQDLAGLWSNYGACVSSDTTASAEVSGGTSLDDDPDDPDGRIYSYAYQSARSLWPAPEAQDLRNRQSGILRANAIDLSVEMVAAGIGAIQDWYGASADREAGTWSIGPFEGFVDLPTDPPAIIEHTIGSGRDFATIGAWLEDTEDRSLVYANQIRVGIVYDDGEYDLGSGRLQARRVLTDAAHYRELRSAPEASRFDPTYDTGVRVTSSLGANLGLLDIVEHYFRVNGIRFESTYPGSSSRSVIRITGHRALVDAVAAIQESGTGSTTIGIDVDASFVMLKNAVVRGAGDATNGLTRGIQVHDCAFSRVYHCIADQIDGAGGSGYGIQEGLRASRVAFSNCIATESGTQDLKHPAGLGPTTQSFCASSDASAEGPGAQTGVARAALWNDPDLGAFGDYRLLSTSPALNAGRNLRFWMSADWNGDPRYAPFDLGIFEGIVAAPLVGKAPWRDDLARIATLWGIHRTDGESLFFTDANEPLPWRGQVYVAADGVIPGSTRAQSGLKEKSLSILGAVTSDRITVADLAAGRYRFARVEATLINWRDLFALPYLEETFWVSDIEHDAEVWKVDPAGIAQRLEEAVGGLVTVDCGYKLGDGNCTKDVSGDTYDDVRVATIVRERREFDANSGDIPDAGTYADGFFKWATITWLSGANAGIESEAKKYTAGTRRFVLLEDLPFEIDGADTFHLRPGCGGRYMTDCVGTWANGRNFGADPFMPGPDAQFQTAQR